MSIRYTVMCIFAKKKTLLKTVLASNTIISPDFLKIQSDIDSPSQLYLRNSWTIKKKLCVIVSGLKEHIKHSGYFFYFYKCKVFC